MVTAAVIATSGLALFWYVQREEVRGAERNITSRAMYAEKSILRDELRPADVAQPVTGARLKRLDDLFVNRVLVDGGLRMKIYRAPDGLVTYSNAHSLIGQPNDDIDEFRRVLGGEKVRDIAQLNHEGGPGKDVKALEVYVLLQIRGRSKPVGV